MLLKNLKKLIKEADEAADEGKEGSESEPEKQRKPSQDDKNIKDASDGIGNEGYELSTEIGEMLQSSLAMYFELSGVDISNGSITITDLKDKTKAGNLISLEQAQAIIGQLVRPALDRFKGEYEYELNYMPLTATGKGSFLITVVKKAAKVDKE